MHRQGRAPEPQEDLPDWYAPPPSEWEPYLVDLDLAHAGRRLAARLIDHIAAAITSVMAGFVLLTLLVPDRDSDPSSAAIAAILTGVLGVFYLYEAAQLAVWGRTLGMCALKMRVAAVHSPDLPLSPARGYGRAASYFTFFLLFGVLPVLNLLSLFNALWLLWDRPHRQCLHDKMAGTIVLNDRAPERRAQQSLLILVALIAFLVIGISLVTVR
ncbi:RDD family protein [Actinomadura rubrisoli]|uniref:RDD family protein n=1 Tax=Actinomadura rubrisoli TaxID=2530368 RepID=A0A4R5B4E7_9ACTN|nr:RDD family protein [Actinomadura rubrisoli]TDD79166.1 RDD family protein [Actinomadura rubrisoli]